ncbi:MAG: hypothetical protein KF819_23195 [Labilithrix sp.]|nr:hypothetical protein [Labilithrix sp.]
MKIGLVSAAAAALLVLGGSARAQAPAAKAPAAPVAPATITTSDYVEQQVDGNQVVTFPGDTLPGDTNSTFGYEIRPPPRVLRAGLIRPRVNFVSELLKSVENL